MSSAFLYGANVFANGIRQHYLRYGGRGEALILIPGITSPAITWGFVAEKLAERYDVYVLDVRGRGLSSTGPDLEYGLDAMAADVVGLATALGLSRPALLGHSMGARIAIRASVTASDAFSRLVLVDPPVSGPGRRDYPSKLPWYVDSIRLSLRGIDAEGMKTFCPSWTDEQLRLRAEWLHTCYEPAIVTAFEDFHKDDIFPDIGRLSVPSMLMVAGRGGVIEKVDVDEAQALCPALEITHVTNAGHMIPWDDFDGFFVALGDFLSR
ncbi:MULTISPECIES: alpha/beta fold hydrolase [Agrobacterium]|uniref:Alpha/beta hydrolase n=1 Tax=Agrobacterium tumefaciens TaxID=358 RepID=A0AAE6EHP1_AGRTU|nr:MULTISPECIES: alpha/beta hydrolase [Agrobacterium]QCL77191.1 alpha/beta hydrolase [Agrobacterium tumefaciens]QCL82699.1 alpha/beta hydrolase [Agrobacterium tumefaciens]CUX70442.1 N-formylmaleamate deformylase [Agrobacterium sp. NCPPB 925]